MYFDIVPKINIQEWLFQVKESSCESPFFTEGYRAYSFNYLRNALDFLFKYGNFPKRRVVFPGFICPVVVEVAVRNKIEPVLIDVNRSDFNLNLEALQHVDLHNVDAVLINHTFGSYFDIEPLKIYLAGSSIKIIEDRAHLPSWKDSASFGDYILLSCYKYFGNLGGGVLITKEDFSKDYGLLADDTFTIADIFRLPFITNGFHHFFIKRLRRQRIGTAEDPATMKFCPKKASNRIQNWYYNQVDKRYGEINQRQRIFELYQKNVAGDFLDCQNPVNQAGFNFSIVLKKPYQQYRDQVLRKLREADIFADRMWYNAAGVLKNYRQFMANKELPVTDYLAQGIINLPIEARYTEKDVRHIIMTLKHCLDKIYEN